MLDHEGMSALIWDSPGLYDRSGILEEQEMARAAVYKRAGSIELVYMSWYRDRALSIVKALEVVFS
jgi:hypothetical protein